MTDFEPTLSSEKLKEATGKDWDQWLEVLDQAGAIRRTHTEIARWLIDDQGVPGWWAQSITVGYERARGLREPGQRADGWSVTASKTIEVPVQKVFDAFEKESIRDQWLPEAELHLRTATAPVSARYDWGDGSTRLIVGFEALGPAKSRVALEHEKLPDAQVADRMKDWWRERVAELKELLEKG
ncbi:MAG: hypothetical protein KDB54_12175 [Solirubrobacterales bacterium]|jgi:uncharacterized protein YndB with AHSA1/START domain|nr:hypothetical protein [Solirubrobacterales bacterium]MCB0861398.1 hypothetical protein [Solirubrobacterales bacterium]